MQDELPTINNYATSTHLYAPTYTSSGSNPADLLMKVQGHPNFAQGELGRQERSASLFEQMFKVNEVNERAKAEQERLAREAKKMAEQANKRRIVRVYIVDSDQNLPLDKAILFQGNEQLTDLTDEELFLEIGIKPLLEGHNAVRALTLDKKASTKAGKDVHLEPIRIRDLKMVVSTVAAF